LMESRFSSTLGWVISLGRKLEGYPLIQTSAQGHLTCFPVGEAGWLYTKKHDCLKNIHLKWLGHPNTYVL
jgi:hypothetical protein